MTLGVPYEDLAQHGLDPALPDCTGPLEAAMNSAAGAGRAVLLPPGVYTVGAARVPAGTRLLGTPGAVLRGRAGAIVVLQPVGDDVTIRDLTIDGGGGTTGNPTNAGAIQCGGAGNRARRRIRVEHCRITNTWAHAIRLVDTAGDIHVVDNEMDEIGLSGNGYFLAMNGNATDDPEPHNIEFARNTCRRAAPNSAGYGTMIRGSDDGLTHVMGHVRICDNYIDHSNAAGGLGIECWADYLTLSGNQIVGTVGTTGGFGISYGVRSHGVISGNTIQGKGIGIEAQAANGAYSICTSNVVRDCPSGIMSWSGLGKTIVSDNQVIGSTSVPVRVAGEQGVCVGNLVDCPAAPVGIQQVQYCRKVVVADNFVAVAPTGTAISVANNGAGSTQRFTVTGNVVDSGNVGVQITGASTAVQVGKIVANELTACPTKVLLNGSSTKTVEQVAT